MKLQRVGLITIMFLKPYKMQLDELQNYLKPVLANIEAIEDLGQKVELINHIKKAIHEISPFKSEPVDCVLWVRNDTVHANSYNPNAVAPPEFKLLEHSINTDGYTQPIVTALDSSLGQAQNDSESREVIDGFHRNRVGKESEIIQERVKGYLPVVTIRETQLDLNDRMAATVRHNRARGQHQVDSMADMVIALKRRKWSDQKIGRELGMEPDEVLRLAQITGLAEMFADKSFTEAWEAERDEA